MNILSMVMQYFGPVIMNKIAGSLGINSTLAQRALAAAVPAILAGIVGKTAQPGGAKILSDLIGKQDPGLLGKLGEMIGTGQQAAVVEQGTGALGSLLGNSTLGSLAGALSKQAGLGVGASNTLLGLVTPAVLGTLGKEQKSAGLDAAGLANMLINQKKTIADAVPADFAKLLGGTGLLDVVQGHGSEVNSKTGQTASTTRAAGSSVPSGSSYRAGHDGSHQHHHHFAWWPWLAAIGAAGVLWWSVFGHKALVPHPTTAIPAVVQPSTTLATSPPPMPAIIASTDVGRQVVNVIDEMKASLGGVRDAAAAQAALPKIQEIAGRLEKLNSQASQLGPEARRALATYVGSQTGIIKMAINNVLALPGVANLLRPVLEQMLGRVEGLAKA